jgi:hypothetical protein
MTDQDDYDAFPSDYTLYQDSVCVIWDGQKLFNQGVEVGSGLDFTFLPDDILTVVTDAAGGARIEVGDRTSNTVTDVNLVPDIANNVDWWTHVEELIP